MKHLFLLLFLTTISINTYAEPIATGMGSGDCSFTPLFRYHNVDPGHGDHFFTTNFNEVGYGAKNSWGSPNGGYQFESVVGLVAEGKCTTDGTKYDVPLRRLYDGKNHLYSTDPNENPSGYQDEGTIGYLSRDGSSKKHLVNMYRYYNSKIHDHMISRSGRKTFEGDWNLEGRSIGRIFHPW